MIDLHNLLLEDDGQTSADIARHRLDVILTGDRIATRQYEPGMISYLLSTQGDWNEFPGIEEWREYRLDHYRQFAANAKSVEQSVEHD